MAIEKLIIYDKFELPDGHLVIGLNTPHPELRDKWRNITPSELKSQFEGKIISILGKNAQFQTSVVGVSILTSLADFKNVYLKLQPHTDTLKIQVLDEVEIEL